MTRLNQLILLLALLAAVAGGYVEHRERQPTPPDASLIGQPLPALQLRDLDGKPHALTDYRGQRVLLNFWASWCGPCLQEIPALALAQKKFAGQGALVVGIAMDEPARVRAFVAAHPLGYPLLLGQLAEPSTTLQLGDRTETLPYSVLVGADGRIIALHDGALSAAQMARWLQASAAP
jgi:peroxiredoxin